MKHRKPNRLKSYDYNKTGYYFITINTHNKIKFFGRIIDRKMELSKIGDIANRIWFTIPEYHENIKLDTFIIMPDHIIRDESELNNIRQYIINNPKNWINKRNAFLRSVRSSVRNVGMHSII